MEATKNLSQLK